MKRVTFIFLFLSFCFINCLSSCSEKEQPNKKVIKLNPDVLINKIDGELNETSGLIWFDNRLWTFNDSGGKEEIYALNSDGEIVTTVKLDDAKNIDWESITHDKKHIYIGDFGNNSGARDNLKVYKISKKKLQSNKSEIKAKADKIKFSYKEQQNFSPRNNAHEFDCEAMFSFKDELFLFSKDWKNLKTTIYKLPKKSGDYKLSPSNSFDVKGLITGADLSPNGKYFAMVGYYQHVPFLYLFKFDSVNTFSTKCVYFDLISIEGAQTEGVCFINDSILAFSTESTKAYAQKVFSIDWHKYIKYLD